MCGRYSLTAPGELVADLFGLDEVPELAPRYNIAPTQEAPVVRREGDRRALAPMRWGLVPPWAEDAAAEPRMINARVETAASRPAFRDAFRRRRCLLPADGFFEWRRMAGRKQPYLVRRRDRRPLALGGLWERWPGADGPLDSFAILTTDANALVAALHDRMPLILPRSAFDAWLDPDTRAEALAPLLEPHAASDLDAVAVDPWVNDPAHDDPRCVAPAPEPSDEPPPLFFHS